jgi:tetratricopeptide (TPR) repeat protein
MAFVLVYRGEPGAAQALAKEFLPRAREIRDPQVLVPAVAAGSLIEHALGNRAAAGRLIEELEEITRDRPVFRVRHLPEALRLCVAMGALDLAEGLLATDIHQAARHRYAVLTGRAVLAEARGDLREAGRLHGEAAARWADYGFPLEQGQAWLGVGRCLVALGLHREAAAPLAESQRVFDALGARPLRAEAERLLARAGAGG